MLRITITSMADINLNLVFVLHFPCREIFARAWRSNTVVFSQSLKSQFGTYRIPSKLFKNMLNWHLCTTIRFFSKMALLVLVFFRVMFFMQFCKYSSTTNRENVKYIFSRFNCINLFSLDSYKHIWNVTLITQDIVHLKNFLNL